LFAIVFAPPVITFIEKGFHSFRLQRKSADNRDRKIGPPSGAHFNHEQRRLSEDLDKCLSIFWYVKIFDRDAGRWGLDGAEVFGGGGLGHFCGRSLTSVFTNHRAKIAAQRRVARMQASHLSTEPDSIRWFEGFS
jgi:hypothetical protein